MIDKALILCYLSNRCTPREKYVVDQWLEAKSQNKYLMNQYRKILEMLNISNSDLKVLFDAKEGWSELQECMAKTNNQMHSVTSNGVEHDSFPLHIRRFLEK